MTLDVLGASALADRLVAAVGSDSFAPVAFLVAFGAGAAHAVGPGHGKSLAAAYLVGSEGRVRDAAWLGGSVAVMHTFSVLVLAVAWTFFDLSELVSLNRLTSALEVAAGLLVLGLGLWLVRRRLAAHSSRHAHGHGHDHSHGHGHGHDHSHGHSRSLRVSRPSLALLGASGGLTPSPAAFLVLVAGLFSGRSGLALMLVVVFGIGLASVLFATGLLALAGRSVVVRVAGHGRVVGLAGRVGPIVTAGMIALIGSAITVVGVSGLAQA